MPENADNGQVRTNGNGEIAGKAAPCAVRVVKVQLIAPDEDTAHDAAETLQCRLSELGAGAELGHIPLRLEKPRRGKRGMGEYLVFGQMLLPSAPDLRPAPDEEDDLPRPHSIRRNR